MQRIGLDIPHCVDSVKGVFLSDIRNPKGATMTPFRLLSLTLVLLLSCTSLASAEILALLNYESKANQPVRREGIAIMDIDPASSDFGTILMEIPLPSDLVAHHIFFNRDRTKAYITALGRSLLHVVDLTRFPYRLRAIAVPDCQVLEDLVVSEDNRTWFLTCMGSSAVIMGDAVYDTQLRTIRAAQPAAAFILNPHGIAIHNGIDRVLITSTVKPDNMAEAGETVTVLEASTGKCCRRTKSRRNRLPPTPPLSKSCLPRRRIRRWCTLPICSMRRCGPGSGIRRPGSFPSLK